MKQKLMAVAVAGALTAPGLALAQATNVQIYGILDGRVDSMKFSQSSTTAAGVPVVSSLTKQHVQFQAPRWGLRGTENLGGGMQAYFQLEQGLSPDGRPDMTSSTAGVYTFGGRDSYVGLRSSWGAVQFGGFGTAYKGMQGVWNAQPGLLHGGIIMGNGDTTGAMPSPNCNNSVGATVVPAATTGATASCGTQVEANATSFSRRQSNYLEYQTPNMAGIVGKIGWAAAEFKEPSSSTPAGMAQNKPGLWSASVVWAGGPFTVGGAYEEHKGFSDSRTAGTPRDAKDKGWTIGGKWNFGQGQVGLGWESLKYANSAVAGAENNYKLSAWVVNGGFNVTQSGTISAGYSKTAGRKGCGPGLTDAAGTCGSATGAKHFHLGYDHALSKRTSLYALYAKLDNNGNSAGGAGYYYIAGPTGNGGGGVSTGPGAVAPGVDITTYAVGVKHTF